MNGTSIWTGSVGSTCTRNPQDASVAYKRVATVLMRFSVWTYSVNWTFPQNTSNSNPKELMFHQLIDAHGTADIAMMTHARQMPTLWRGCVCGCD